MSSINNPNPNETFKREGDDPSIGRRFREANKIPPQANPTLKPPASALRLIFRAPMLMLSAESFQAAPLLALT